MGNARNQTLQQLTERLESTTDRLGAPIDPGIKETVLYLQAFGFPTDSSCEGHVDHGCPWPWVGISSPDEPPERYQGQQQILRETAQKYGLTPDQVEADIHHPAYRAYWDKTLQQPQTAEHQAWQERNVELAAQLQSLLDEFYQSSNTDPRYKLQLNGERVWIRLESKVPKRHEWIRDELSKEELEQLRLELPLRQAEMRAFTQFLKEKWSAHSALMTS